MARRKRKTTRESPPPRRTKKPAKLHEADEVAGMDPPNHLMPIHVYSEETLQAIHASARHHNRWPLTSALRDCDGNLQGIFVDPQHGAEHWSEWADSPPTWMDPHLLLSLAREDPEICQLLAANVKQNRQDNWRRLRKRLTAVFDEKYVPLIMQRFDTTALDVVAQWLQLSYTEETLEKRGSRKSQK